MVEGWEGAEGEGGGGGLEVVMVRLGGLEMLRVRVL